VSLRGRTSTFSGQAFFAEKVLNELEGLSLGGDCNWQIRWNLRAIRGRLKSGANACCWITRKLAGILLEIARESDVRNACAVIGVGNQRVIAARIWRGIDHAWTSLLQAPGSGELNQKQADAPSRTSYRVRKERFDVRAFEDLIASGTGVCLARAVSSANRGWNVHACKGVHPRAVNERGALNC